MKEMDELVQIMKTLRGENGCNWDKKQTHESLIPYLIEETYEVVDALQNKDFPNLKEELGDLLFQIVFHSQLTSESGYFAFPDLVREVSEKLIRRHPHVFETRSDLSSETVLANWDKIKENEKKSKGVEEISVLDGIPRSLPALVRAEQIQKKAAKLGFDWTEVGGVIEKVEEEIAEVKAELVDENFDKTRLEEELGDVLFSVVNLIRFLKFSPELILQKSNQKFEKRFRKMEELRIEKYGRDGEMNLEDWDQLWLQIKEIEKESKN